MGREKTAWFPLPLQSYSIKGLSRFSTNYSSRDFSIDPLPSLFQLSLLCVTHALTFDWISLLYVPWYMNSLS